MEDNTKVSFRHVGGSFRLSTEFKDYTQVQKERISVKDRMKYDFELKTRKQHLNDLKTKVYDILIIWGDANGAEVLLDAASQFL